jgi:hypothetical protein
MDNDDDDDDDDVDQQQWRWLMWRQWRWREPKLTYVIRPSAVQVEKENLGEAQA